MDAPVGVGLGPTEGAHSAPSILSRVFGQIRDRLPRGQTLPVAVWSRRHRAMFALLCVHAIGLPLFGLARGYSLSHSVLEGTPVAAFALLAGWGVGRRRFSSAMVALGLLTSSAVLVHLSGGTIEAHFHFFVMVGILVMYEDWVTFMAAAAYVLVHHGLAGMLDPSSVYNHPAAIADPWTWAGIHALFITGAGLASVTSWRMNEDVRGQSTRALAQARRETAFVELLGNIAAASNEATTVEEALQTCVDAICAHTGWPVGHVYLRSGNELISSGVWHLDDPERFGTFREVTERTRFASGVGLPGRILASRSPAWIVDVTRDGNFPRATEATDIGVRAGFAFPVLAGQEVAGVAEFYYPEAVEPDHQLLEVSAYVGAQLGRVIERKRAEEELERALEKEREAVEGLRALDEMKNMFLEAVSHDLRTPLTVIIGTALTLERGLELSPTEFHDLLGRLASNARRLNKLLADLLDLDRLVKGIVEPNRQLLDVGDLVRRTVEESDLFGQRPIEVQADRVEVEVDAAKVERIVENLLINAGRHTPAGTPVWVRVHAADGGVLIHVEDAGPGVPADLRQTIFEPFRQGPSLAKHSPGVGIGLSLVARFAELHGGWSRVGERTGGGASFQVYLPGERESADSSVA